MNKSILSTREREIFNLLIEGYVTKEISSKLNISEKTVRNHISNVIQKLEVNTRYQAVIELVKLDELKI